MIAQKHLCFFLLALFCLMFSTVEAQFIQQGSKLIGTGGGDAFQASSISLSADGNTAIVGGSGDNSEAGAVWVYTRSGGVWTQQGSKLVGTGAVGNAEQGSSVSLSSDGNTAIVGGLNDNTGVGAAWVFTRSGGVWTQEGNKLVGTGAVGAAQQGYSVSISSDGNTAIVGGFYDNSYVGAAWVFTRSGGAWTQEGNKLVGTGAVGAALQGWSVSISSNGNTAIVGGAGDNGSAGAAWVFTRSGGVWTEEGSKLVGTGAVGTAGQGSSVSVSSDGNTAIVGGFRDNGDAGAAWVFTRSGGVWTQEGSKLVGTGAVGIAWQGWSVAIASDGNTAIVGGNTDNNNAGAAWIFMRSGGVWTQQGNKLVGTGAAGTTGQGRSVSISSDGNTAIVSSGWVYTRNGGVWTQEGNKLEGTGVAGVVNQGVSVSISADGNTAIVGGPSNNGCEGAAWVFTRSGGVWTQEGSKLIGTGAVGNAYQGRSVSISSDGNTAIVGGSGDNTGVGAAWVFTRSGGVWTQEGNKLVGTGAVGAALQGYSVSISSDGNTAIVGGFYDNSYAGAAWVFTRSGGVWTQEGNKLVGTGALGTAGQGSSVSVSSDGNTAIVGGFRDSGFPGAAWVFTRSGGVWTQEGNKLIGTGAVGNAYQGRSVSISSDGNTAIVGGFRDNGDAGAAWVFTRSGGVWTQEGNKLVGTGAVGAAQQGYSVSVSSDGNTAIVGGLGDNSGAGAVWVYTRSAGVWTQQGSKFIGTGAVGATVQGSSVALSADGNTAIVGGSDDNNSVGAVWVYTAVVKETSSVAVQDNWNMVSVPLTVDDYTKTVLYPTAISNAYAYDGAYIAYDLLTNGRGYWVKFPSIQAVTFAGPQRTNDTIAVVEGWNMIGSLSMSIPVSNVGSIPGGILTGNFYGYSSSYEISTTIEPGKGYWVKVTQVGQLVLSSTGNIPSSSRIRIEDSGEQPPMPPDAMTSALPEAYALEQNYPNPFNPTTRINYALPVSEHVRLSVYNMLGQEVVRVVDEVQEAGNKTVSFDASELPSGMYTYRIKAGAFTEVMKMVLIK